MAGLFDFLSGLSNMLGAATYTRPQDIQAVRGLLPQSVDTTLANTLQSPAANDALGLIGGIGTAAPRGVVFRAPGAQVSGDAVSTITRPGHFYRGMEPAEYNATLGSGRGVASAQHYSIPGEGTSFAADAPTAESYANFGSSDPRKTGMPNYLVEVSGSEGLKLDRDGYYKAQSEVPAGRVTRAWEMRPENGGIVAYSIKPLRQK